jgi:hypothetical protein
MLFTLQILSVGARAVLADLQGETAAKETAAKDFSDY